MHITFCLCISGPKESLCLMPPEFSPLIGLRLSNVSGIPCGWAYLWRELEKNNQAESVHKMSKMMRTTRKSFNNYMRRHWKTRNPHMQGQEEAWSTRCSEMFAGNTPFHFLFGDLSSVTLWLMKFLPVTARKVAFIFGHELGIFLSSNSKFCQRADIGCDKAE